MYNQTELLEAIEELQNANHSIQNCGKLASLYTVLDHIDNGYSRDVPNEVQNIEKYGDSDFLRLVSQNDQRKTWLLMDDLMFTLSVTNPRLYNSVMDKLW